MYKERQSLGRQPLVRLPMMIVVAVCLVASACGSRSGITEVEGQDEVVLAGGTLDYYGWEGYDRFFGAADPVIDDLGITFRSIYIGSAPEIAARFATGGGRGIDLLAWTSTNHHQLRNTPGVLSPISEDEVPNLAGLISQFGDDQWNHFKDDDGNWLAIPFSFAPLGITYDVTQVRPSAYADLLVPELKGRIGVPDGPGMHALVASAALGYEAQTLSPAQLEGVVSFMRRVWGQARLVSPSYGDIVALLDAGEIAAAYGGYPGLAAFTTNQNIRTVFPAEGSASFAEVYSIPADADNRPAALAFINAMLEPANNAVINDALAQAVTVDEAIDLVSESNRLLYPYEDLEHFFAITPLMSLPYGSHGVTMSDFLDEYSTLVAGG